MKGEEMLRTLFSATILGGALAGTAAQAPDAGCAQPSERTLAQGQELKFNSNAADITKIGNLLEEFRQDILRKDGHALTKLILYPNVLFHSIDDQESVDSARRLNAQFDGIGPSALDGFVKFLAASKDKLEERFQNIEIRQDGDLGLVTFNYDFVINDKVHHSGLEHWQVRKIDGQWKILSVTWTKYGHK
jgi:hypothetical protein